MVHLNSVSMHYPIPKRFIDFFKNPFSTKKFIALNNISIEIKSGDRVAILGSNGAGKTTLLKLIGGLLIPSKGKIEVNGFDTNKDNLKARKSVGFVLNEERSFYWRLTGKENLKFFGHLDNLTGEKLNAKINDVLSLVGMNNNSVNKRFAEYSSGMKQRLAIARGLISEPEILILDEPTRTLDPISAIEIKNIILQKVHKNDKTLLIATHRLEEAEDLCNKIIIMNHGEILFFESVEKILEKYKSILACYKAFIK